MEAALDVGARGETTEGMLRRRRVGDQDKGYRSGRSIVFGLLVLSIPPTVFGFKKNRRQGAKA